MVHKPVLESVQRRINSQIGSKIETRLELIHQVQKKYKMPFILGLSGGIDSAVCAFLLENANVDYHLYYIDINSSRQSYNHATLVASKCTPELQTTRLTTLFERFWLTASRDFKTDNFKEKHPTVCGNIKARLRMIYQYTVANLINGLIVGTENRSENYVGYATKFGDAAADVSLIWDWTKMEVRAAARLLEIPDEIIDKPPTADLWAGQTDENELGFTYDELDCYLLSEVAERIDSKTKEAIEKRHRNSTHKFVYHNLHTILQEK